MVCLARTPWRRSRRRSLLPQATVTGSPGSGSVKRTALPDRRVAVKPVASTSARVSATTAAGSRRAGRA